MVSLVKVAVGVIYRDEQLFITKRHQHQHQGDRWEFPGGKIEKLETAYEALCRELMEEVGIEVINANFLQQISHHYPDKSVELQVWLVTQFLGNPKGKEGQQGRWIAPMQLSELTFPEANQPIIQQLLKSLS